MTMKTLIVYASKYGFTRDCVQRLKDNLDGDVTTVDLKESSEKMVAQYDHVIIGGSIYMGMLNKVLKKWMEEHQAILLSKKLGLFITCSAVGDVADKQIKSNFSQDLYQKAEIKDYFGGKLDVDKASFFDKLIIKMVSKADKSERETSKGMEQERIEKFALFMNK